MISKAAIAVCIMDSFIIHDAILSTSKHGANLRLFGESLGGVPMKVTMPLDVYALTTRELTSAQHSLSMVNNFIHPK